MTLEQLGDSLPEYAKDLKLNLQSVLRQTELSPAQTWGTAVSCALSIDSAPLLAAVKQEASTHLSAEALNGAHAAFSVMSMNNVFYRFRHLTTNEKYATMPARLRMNVIKNHGADPLDFELWCLAVSAINACETCVGAHEKVLLDKGITEEQILAAVRIASVIFAVGQVLRAETKTT
jgi:lipoyl-dependent peroxiredoxin subunit D